MRPGQGRLLKTMDLDVPYIDIEDTMASLREVLSKQSHARLEKRDWEKIPLAMATPLFGEALKMMPAGSTYRFCMPKPDGTMGAPQSGTNIIVTLIDVRVAPATED